MSLKKTGYFYSFVIGSLLIGAPLTGHAASSDALKAPSQAYVIQGGGSSACPASTLCLYQHVGFGGKILAIPSGNDVGNFADYGFDHGSDGVSAIVNNTQREIGLLSGLYLKGEILKIPAGAKINRLSDYSLGDGSWNDAAQSVVSSSVIHAAMPLTLRGPLEANAGEHIAYFVEVSNSGPNDAAQAAIKTLIPGGLRDVSVICQATGANCGKASADGTYQPVSLPKGGHAAITLTGTIQPDFEGSLSITSSIESPKMINTAADTATIMTAVKKVVVKNLNVSAALLGSWSDWQTGGQIYSYRITMKAARKDVRKWEVSFDGLPEGVKIYNKSVLWTDVISDGSDGHIKLGTPATGVHRVAAGKSLDIDLQLLYPTKDDAYQTLRNLTSTKLK